jgi:SAM-dependent methyltransferase
MPADPLTRFPWPALDHGPAPVWTGRGFLLGDASIPVLSYRTGESGWTDDLTSFHEDTAGSDHPIDVASREAAVRSLRLVTAKRPVVLEVGCSSGFMLRHLRSELPSAALIGSDYVLGPLQALSAEAPDVPFLHFDLTRCPLPDGCVDAVVMLNVLEHIEDDAGALREVRRILRPGGLAVIEVPAGPELFDVYDRLLLHHRRYRLTDLKRLLGRAGFRIVRATHLGVLVYPAFYARKRWNQRFLGRDRATQERIVASNIRSTASSRLLASLFDLEQWLGRRVQWPFGIRCIVAAGRP